jgi:hypothetical protein
MTDGAWGRLLRAAWLVPVPVLLLYGIWIFASYGPGHDPRDAALIGRHFVTQSQASSVIKLDPGYSYPAGESGYDGEFVYFIALDPVNARYYVDAPSYRYTRIVYPLLARVLALGRPSLIPWTLLLINWLAIGGGTLAAAFWLERRGQPPWFALAYGFYPGLLVALQRDTTEALAYGLVALGIFLWDLGGRRRIIWSALVFALAALTRETTVVFPVLYGLGLILSSPHPALPQRGRENSPARREGALLIGAAVVPLLIYKAFLVVWLGTRSDPGLLLERVPFLGLIAARQSTYWLQELWVILIPAMICSVAAILALRRRVRLVEAWVVLVNVLLFVVLLSRTSYVDIYSSSRVATGVVLAAVVALPAFSAVIGTRLWFWLSGSIWVSPLPFWVVIPELRWGVHLTGLFRHVACRLLRQSGSL